MRRGVAAALAACLLPVSLAGCAAHQTVILVPDPDGRVGEAEVATAGGTQRLTRPGDMTRVSGPAAPPSAVTTADPGFIASTFSAALAIEPAPSERFILYFESGTTVLDPRSPPVVASIAAAIERRGAISVSISGHTDATGPDAFNDALSLARARRVEALLLERRVPPRLISVSSHGKGNPAIRTPDGVAEPRNRRVEVVVQ